MPRVGGRPQAETVAQRFAALSVRQESHVVGASLRLACTPKNGETADAPLKPGDSAMYERKQAARIGRALRPA